MPEKADRDTILAEINAERDRQIASGYDEEHDDEHNQLELRNAAVAILEDKRIVWPWDIRTFERLTSQSYDRRLVVAGAFLVAEAQRMLRKTRNDIAEERARNIDAVLVSVNDIHHIEDLEEIEAAIKRRTKFLEEENKKK